MRGKVKWEGMWVIFVECVAYAAGLGIGIHLVGRVLHFDAPRILALTAPA